MRLHISYCTLFSQCKKVGIPRQRYDSHQLLNHDFRTETIVKAAVASFTLDNWFREVTIDSRKVTSCFFLEQCEEEKRRNSEEGANVTSKEKVTKLVQVQKLEKDQTTRIERTVDSSGEIMNVKMTINDVISTAVFKKV